MRNRWKEGGGGSGSSSSSVLLVASWYLSPFPSFLIFEKRIDCPRDDYVITKRVSLSLSVISQLSRSSPTADARIFLPSPIITSHTREMKIDKIIFTPSIEPLF